MGPWAHLSHPRAAILETWRLFELAPEVRRLAACDSSPVYVGRQSVQARKDLNARNWGDVIKE